MAALAQLGGFLLAVLAVAAPAMAVAGLFTAVVLLAAARRGERGSDFEDET